MKNRIKPFKSNPRKLLTGNVISFEHAYVSHFRNFPTFIQPSHTFKLSLLLRAKIALTKTPNVEAELFSLCPVTETLADSVKLDLELKSTCCATFVLNYSSAPAKKSVWRNVKITDYQSVSLPTEHKMKPHLLSSQMAGLTDIRQRLNNSYNAIQVKGFFFQRRLPAFLVN